MRESEKNSTKWRKARLRLDLGQKEFAEKLGVGAGYISEIESGKKEPSYTLAELFRLVCEKEFCEEEIVASTKSGNTAIESQGEENEMLKDELLEAHRTIIKMHKEIDFLKDELLKKETQLATKLG